MELIIQKKKVSEMPLIQDITPESVIMVVDGNTNYKYPLENITGDCVESLNSTDNHIVVDNTDPKKPTLSFQLVDNENLLTDDELAVVQATSGTNTGDQDLSGLQTKEDVLLETESINIVGAINEVNAIAKGAGNYLSSVATNSTLTGNGTPASPLAIPYRTVVLVGSTIDMIANPAENYTRTAGTLEQFTISNPIIGRTFRLYITGGTLNADLFSGYTESWILGSLVTDYVPAISNMLVCEIRSAGTIHLFWGE